jgi:enoyl-CoA hydratase/carnithine racemase
MPAELKVVDDGAVRVIRLSHPARRNALDEGAIAELAKVVRGAEVEGVRCLLLRGEGTAAFCAGYDLTALAQVGPEGELPDERLEETLELLATSPVPSIALVHGPAFGAGCDLACACDFRIGSGQATFCMPPARLGVVYAAGGISRVSSLVGPTRAKRMFFTGAAIPPGVAFDWGLLDELHDLPEPAEQAAFALARQIAGLAPLAVHGMKRTFAALAGKPLSSETAHQLRALRRAAFQSEDAAEGRAAFLEKRPPSFKGR